MSLAPFSAWFQSVGSLVSGLFGWRDIPWEDLAFPSVRWALGHFDEVRDQPVFAPRSNPPGEVGQFTGL